MSSKSVENIGNLGRFVDIALASKCARFASSGQNLSRHLFPPNWPHTLQMEQGLGIDLCVPITACLRSVFLCRVDAKSMAEVAPLLSLSILPFAGLKLCWLHDSTLYVWKRAKVRHIQACFSLVSSHLSNEEHSETLRKWRDFLILETARSFPAGLVTKHVWLHSTQIDQVFCFKTGAKFCLCARFLLHQLKTWGKATYQDSG